MLKEKQNLGKNNLELEDNIQKEPDRKMIFKNTILATLCCWLLLTLFYQLFDVGIRKMVLEFMGDEKIRSLFNSWWAGFDRPIYFLGFLPFLVIGFYFALKKERKFFFFYPFFLLLPPFVIYSFIATFACWGMGAECFERFSPGSRMIYLLLLSILIIKIFYLKKERFLLVATGILFFIFLLSTIALANYSITTLNPKLCEQIIKMGTEREVGYCFYHLALRTKNFDFCEKIQEGFRPTTERCYQDLSFIFGEYKNILKKCQNLSYHERNQCVKDIAIEQKDIELCKRVEYPYGEGCKKEVRFVVEVESNKIFESCKTILNKESQKKCVKEIVFNINDFELCKKTLGEIPCKNYFFAIKTNNPDVCTEDPADLYLPVAKREYNKCIIEIAINTNNLQLCETKTKGGKTRGRGWMYCFKTFAVRTKRPEICENIRRWRRLYERCVIESQNEK